MDDKRDWPPFRRGLRTERKKDREKANEGILERDSRY